MEYRKLTKKEIAWANELQKVINKMPDTLWIFTTSSLHVMPYDENGNRYLDGNSMDSKCNLITIKSKREFDGGDW